MTLYGIESYCLIYLKCLFTLACGFYVHVLVHKEDLHHEKLWVIFTIAVVVVKLLPVVPIPGTAIGMCKNLR